MAALAKLAPAEKQSTTRKPARAEKTPATKPAARPTKNR